MLMWIGSIIEACVSYVMGIFRATYLIGKLLALILVKVAEIGTHLSSLAHNVAFVICECLQTFAYDIDYRYNHILRMLNEGLQNGVNDIGRALNRTGAAILWSLNRSKNETYKAIKRSRDLFTRGAFGARELVIQIGYTAWMLIILAGETIISILVGTYRCVLTTVLDLAEGVVYAAESLGFFAKSSVIFVISVPITSLVGCIAIALVYYNHRSILNIAVHLVRLGRRLSRRAALKIDGALSAMGSRCAVLFHAIGRFLLRLRDILCWLRNKILRRSDAPVVDPVADPVPVHEVPDPILCIVCKEEKRSIVLLPCRHLCTCRSCYITLNRLKYGCPLCRTKIREPIPIYM